MIGNGERAETADRYRPIQAVSMTGIFPGFARPHFTPENLGRSASSANTVYVQQVTNERIAQFEPLEQDITEHIIPIEGASGVQPGDPAIYAYAFSLDEAVVGTRDHVANVITQRFDEISPKEFAACTAAHFAQLIDRLPAINRKLFRLLAEFDSESSREWRDTTVFRCALRDKLQSLPVPPRYLRLHTIERNDRLEVDLSLWYDDPQHLPVSDIENACKKLLSETGLFRRRDVFTLRLESTPDSAHGQLPLIDAVELESALKQAKFFLEEKVFLPALQSSSARTLNIVRDTRQWIARFEKIGDLVRYIDRFKPSTLQGSFSFAQIKQIRFEDVHAEFLYRFGRYRGFQTTSADFIEEASYSPFTLAIFTRTYNNRAGGIRPVGRLGKHDAVVVNITLGGRKYANEWLEDGQRLKCYLKSPTKRGEAQSVESLEANQSIMRYPSVPVLVFTRKPGDDTFIYKGTFRYSRITSDDGGKWFELVKVDVTDEPRDL